LGHIRGHDFDWKTKATEGSSCHRESRSKNPGKKTAGKEKKYPKIDAKNFSRLTRAKQ